MKFWIIIFQILLPISIDFIFETTSMFSLFKKQSKNKLRPKGKLHRAFKATNSEETIEKTYQSFIYAENKKTERKSLLKLIDLCYNNIDNQTELTEMLHLPFLPGPISLHQFPTVLLEQNQVINHKEAEDNEEQTQLEFLFNYLKNVKEYYYCWVIYFNEDLKILNVKLLKRQEIKDHEDMFNPVLNLIGIFINKGKHGQEKIKTGQKIVNYFEQYYGEGKANCRAEDHHNKSISTINNSTGTTWKRMHLQKINEDQENEASRSKFKSTNMKMRSISPKRILKELKVDKGHSMPKNGEDKTLKKEDKSHSIKCLKQKSKSHILLNRSKSNNYKEIILQPIKNQPSIHKAKPTTKTKLKKQTKIHKIQSIYFKKPHHHPME